MQLPTRKNADGAFLARLQMMTDCIYLAVSGLQTDIFKINFRAAWIITAIAIVAFLAKIIVVI